MLYLLYYRSLYHIFEQCEGHAKPLPVPFPDKGEVFDYQIVKEGLGQWVPLADMLKEVPPIPKDAQY